MSLIVVCLHMRLKTFQSQQNRQYGTQPLTPPSFLNSNAPSRVAPEWASPSHWRRWRPWRFDCCVAAKSPTSSAAATAAAAATVTAALPSPHVATTLYCCLAAAIATLPP